MAESCISGRSTSRAPPKTSIDRTGQLRPDAEAWSRVQFLGLPFCLLSQQQAVRLLIDRCGPPYRYVVTPNAFNVVTAYDNPETLLPIYRGAWLSLCDSRVVRGLARLERLSLPLVTGSDLVAALLSMLDSFDPGRPSVNLAIVGPPPALAQDLRTRYPNLRLDILPAPFGLATDAQARLAVARACVAASWDILLLCLGEPTQALIAQQIAELGRTSGVALCVGAAIDFLAGKRRRAPLLLQKLGLEWAYRLAQEPRRLWRRYLLESPNIFRIFIAMRQTRAL